MQGCSIAEGATAGNTGVDHFVHVNDHELATFVCLLDDVMEVRIQCSLLTLRKKNPLRLHHANERLANLAEELV